VTTIYLEPNLLAFETAGEAAAQLRYLAESGAELVVVSVQRLADWDVLDVAGLRYEASADGAQRGDWWLTADPEDCSRRPLHGVHSMLIAGALDTSDPHTVRCDLSARDLRSAVLEILSRQAMPGTTGAAVAG